MPDFNDRRKPLPTARYDQTSPEHREKISLALKAYWDRKRREPGFPSGVGRGRGWHHTEDSKVLMSLRRKRADWQTPEERELFRRAKHYPITWQELQELVKTQDGKCCVCGDPWRDIDHDHQTGLVRGLLCRRCNQMLGFIERYPERVARLQEYVDANRLP